MVFATQPITLIAVSMLAARLAAIVAAVVTPWDSHDGIPDQFTLNDCKALQTVALKRASMATTTESKAELTNRIRREGRWDAASEFMGKVRTEAKKDGMKQAEAREAAWLAVADEYPPLPESELPAAKNDPEPLSMIDPQTLTSLPDSTAETFEEDTFWVYNNLESPEVDYSSAPSKGCVALFRWAKRQPDKFVDRVVGVVTKAMKEKVQKVDPAKENIARNKAHTQSIRERLGMA